MQNNIKGKLIKDYVLQDVIFSEKQFSLLTAKKQPNIDVTVLMFDKKNIQQTSFVAYHNLLAENNHRIHPKYIEIVQSTNNFYLILQKISRIKVDTKADIDHLIMSIVRIYQNIGQFKLTQHQLFINSEQQIVYLPFYKKVPPSVSKFYAQFHNKSMLGDIFSKIFQYPNKNILLDIFIKNVDHPRAKQILKQQLSKLMRPQKSPELYPDLNLQDNEQDDEQILLLMSKVKVNSSMKQQAQEQFMRQSAKVNQLNHDKEMKNIMENVQSSMLNFKNVKTSKTHKTKLELKENDKLDNNKFDVYFKSYLQTMRFLKKVIKQFLSYYKNKHSGIISSYLLVLIVTLKKAYAIKALESFEDIFQLDIDMRKISINKYICLLKAQMKNEAKMIVELRTIIENLDMPMKSYTTLAPYLQENISLIDFDKLQIFTFYFISALLKNRKDTHIHFLYSIECMYILLHGNYEIVFFIQDFPKEWNKQYFDQKVVLIENLVPYLKI